MTNDVEALRRQIEALQDRVEVNERLLAKTIGTLSITSSFADNLLAVFNRYYVTDESYAVQMSMRGIRSAMESAMRDLQHAVVKARNE